MGAGNKETTLASEETQRRNIVSMMQHGNETRKMVKELGIIIDAVQNRVIAQNEEIKELRRQLAALQQQFYLKGSTSYGD